MLDSKKIFFLGKKRNQNNSILKKMLSSKSKNLLFRTGLDLMRQNESNNNNTNQVFLNNNKAD